MFLMIDNYDSFTYNLVRYLENLKEYTQIYRNDKITIDDIINIKPQGIIISPGPKRPEDSGICIEIIKKFSGKIPILGICLGHQTIAYAFGGKIIKGKKPMHGKISEIYHNGKGVFKNIKNPVKVTRYHSLVVSKENLPDCLNITAETSDGIIMGIRHKDFLVEGVQFHPEAELTEDGYKMLGNFIQEAKNYKKINN
ncbi:anthranilate synthase component II [Clostridium pasteurianum]|uniref:Glutamine amidotransferase of anthranilate synthase or aminodeoxychorismate synthase n=1 Tax=Clostridium pasteurianum BC1 TaxID=86416 RepID=R4KDL7_CLOPA|nr:aminodeoxychorismate/anthranilate synthase component II [Clostridium pasteurianum]AGK97715.1 glutamine amidotransferase of anthranilate synthase or aminodeoxychorismate synthase [Clostridium pasteurianum BC1]